jgi:hypothetical protein
MQQHTFLSVFMALCTLACSAADPERSVLGNTTAGAGGTSGQGGGGSGGGSGASGMSVIDNPDNTPPPVIDLPDAGEECMPGMRCNDQDSVDEDDCGSQELMSTVEEIDKPGNVLVIFDRSGSMTEEWNGAPKYEAAGNAIIAAMQPLQDLLTIGGLFFPSVDMSVQTCECNIFDPAHWIPGPGACCLMGTQSSCIVSTIDQPDQINFVPGADFITALPNQWLLQGAGRTPLETGVTRARDALMSATLEGSINVIIVTDGAPNCSDTNDINVIGDRVSAIATEWLAQGIKTHVVGLPGAGEAATILNEIAVAGGTGAFIEPSDPMALQMRLQEVLKETVMSGIETCEITLDPPAEAPEKLHLVVTENGMERYVPRDLGGGAGWKLSDDAATVTLEGAFCDESLSGRYSNFKFEFGCVDPPPIPPLTPPQ